MAGQPPPGPLGTAAVEPRRESGALTQHRPKQAALGPVLHGRAGPWDWSPGVCPWNLAPAF